MKISTGDDRFSDYIFYLSNQDPLEIDRYDFHQSKVSTETLTKHSYIYMLFNLQNTPISKLKQFFDSSLPSNPIFDS